MALLEPPVNLAGKVEALRYNASADLTTGLRGLDAICVCFADLERFCEPVKEGARRVLFFLGHRLDETGVRRNGRRPTDFNALARQGRCLGRRAVE